MDKGINKNEMLLLADKIEMYRSEELKLQESIKSVLDELKLCIQDDNFKTFSSRLNSLYEDFETSIINKERYTELVLKIVNSYEAKEKEIINSVKW